MMSGQSGYLECDLVQPESITFVCKLMYHQNAGTKFIFNYINIIILFNICSSESPPTPVPSPGEKGGGLGIRLAP